MSLPKFMIFCDASYDRDTRRTAVAWVRIDEKGNVHSRAHLGQSSPDINQAELYAVFYALRGFNKLYPDAADLTIYSDSKNTVDGITQLQYPPTYRLWELYQEEARGHTVDVIWRKAKHNHYSQLAHQLAYNTLRRIR